MIKQQSLSKNELKLLREINIDNFSLEGLAKALSKSRFQTSRLLSKLREKGFLNRIGNKLIFQKQSFIPILLDILDKNTHLIPILADSGINILKEMLEPSSIKDLESKTNLKQAIIYRKVKEAQKFSIVRKENKKYFLNSKIWPELKEFLESYKRYLIRISPHLDSNILIRGKYDNIIIAESAKEIKDSCLTAFSVYSNYGIGIITPFNYYHIPKEKLSIKQIFKDSLIILRDDPEYRKQLYAMLFYLKNKSKLKGIKSELVYKLREILSGKKIEGYPSLNDIKEKAQQFDIKL
jgi:predicted transcriptional regulator